MPHSDRKSKKEAILKAARRRDEVAAAEQKVTQYYSSLSRKEMEEQAVWGKFALGEFPDHE